MDIPEQLRRRALRGYERGRLAMALRPAWVVLLVAAGLAWWSDHARTCLCLGALAAAVVATLRFVGRGGTEAASDGLTVGAVVALVGLAGLVGIPACDVVVASPWCEVGCGMLGLAAGSWLGRRMRTRRAPVAAMFGAVIVAASAAAVGCLGLGTGALLGLAASMATGCAAAGLLSRSPVGQAGG